LLEQSVLLHLSYQIEKQMKTKTQNQSIESLLQGTGISTRNESTAQLLDKFGLNWKVNKMPLFLNEGVETGFYGIVREDNMKTFATCKEGYTPYQNEELVDLVSRAAGQIGLNVNRGGKFKDGALVYLQIESGLVTGLGQNNDTVEKYISAINSHDGSAALKWGMTNTTISCQNSFWAAYRQIKHAVRHTESMHARIDEIIGDIETILEAEKTLYEKYFRLADMPATKKHIQSVVQSTLGVDVDSKANDLTGYKLNRLNDLCASINSEMEQKGETLWGLFSGVTHYTTHKMTGTDEKRQQSKAVGMGFTIDNEVFRGLEMEMA
jgi:phage/plasmid-like protein (TIGR03299 family)